MRRLFGVLIVLLVAAYAFGLPLFLTRDDDPLPKRVDAVVALAGSDESFAAARALVDGGVGKTLVVSSGRTDRRSLRSRTCREEQPDVICVNPGPDAGIDEAQAVSSVIRNHRWQTVVLVTSRYSLLRQARAFERCGDFRIVEVGVDESWVRTAIAVPLEWLKLGVSETVRRGC
jgi:uncharacterized SAM-binding protein YcdF (DUF218 family)